MTREKQTTPSKSTAPTLIWERKLGYPLARIAGVDEVGRGCLAGPVVAAAVILPPDVSSRKDPWIKEIRDSKLLDAETRERLAPLIEGWAAASAIGMATVEEIDRINIYHASHLAMLRALEGLSVRPDHLIVDGKFLPKGLPCPATAIVKGDMRCLSVAAASVIAKVWRDRRMQELEATHPGYGFASHKGYSTPVHLAALKERGPCVIHRRSFAPVRAGLEAAEAEPHAGIQGELLPLWEGDRGPG